MPDISLLIYHLILPMLEFFRHALGSYGWAIIAVTIATKLILLPLSMKQSISSKKAQENMAKMRPEFDKLKSKFELRRKKFEGNAEKLMEVQKEFQTEMMGLYRNGGGFNPLSGCLPLLAQFPILLALYWAFSGSPFQASIMNLPLEATTKSPTYASEKFAHSKAVNFVGSDGRIARFSLESDIPDNKKLLVGEEYNLQIDLVKGNPDIKVNADDIFWRLASGKGKHDLHPTKQDLMRQQLESGETDQWAEGVIEFAPSGDDDYSYNIKALKETDGKFSVEAILMNSRAQESFSFIKDLGRIGIYDGKAKEIHWDIAFLIVLLIASFWATTKFMATGTPQMPSLDPNQEQMQKKMQSLMPILFASIFIFLPLPAAVFLYFLVSNVIQVLQTVLLNKFYSPDAK